jgi:Ser/Thr protein kinase RdoA (MazF antagonist)
MADIFESLLSPAPTLSPEEALDLLRCRYGLDGQLKPLVSERDQNFLVTIDGESRYVLKIANSAESDAVTEFQIDALRHVASVAPDFPVPRVIRARDGEWMSEVTTRAGSRHCVRLLSWLEGVPLQHAKGVESIAAQTGSCLATLAHALRDFRHPASDYPLLWDIRNAAHLADLLSCVDNVDLRDLCQARLVRFREVIRPRLEPMRKQVVYNDMNPSNILVAPDDVNRLSGVIDFGDMVHSHLVNDVAVAAAYLCKDEDDPFTEVLQFLSAYTRLSPLTEDEIALLPELILTRHLTTVMITHWRASLYPANRDYILRNEARARQMLFRVANMPLEDTARRFAHRVLSGHQLEVVN